MSRLVRRRPENGCDRYDVLPFSTSPYLPNNQQVQPLFDPDSHSLICKLPLACDDTSFHFICSLCHREGTSYYFCPTCEKKFHKECVESPLDLKHPSYPFLSLQLYLYPTYYHWKCVCCEEYIYDMAYHCPTNNLIMHPFCVMKPIPIFIDHPKRHPHFLTFFPKQNSLACNVCARCVFVVHQDCIYFPYVIRISRHQHRISFTYSLPSGKSLSCGVCRQKVDNNCGAYSCNNCADYFVHSRCALRRDLWDGVELEEIPQEPEIAVEPFQTIADGIILHFSHGHRLNLEISRVYDDDKFCQACILPIYEGSYYSCMDRCDFILREACANSPLKKHHQLHARSLTLKVDTEGNFFCDACRRKSSGFFYEDLLGDREFRLDLRCVSVSEPFEYQGHVHPLFLALTREAEESVRCQICQTRGASYHPRMLNCIKCDYVICFICATLPYKAMYKHDKHFLTFREWKGAAIDQMAGVRYAKSK